MTAVLLSVLEITDDILQCYIYILIIGAILSWLLAFGVINRYNRGVEIFSDVTRRLTDPLLRPIRHYIRPVNGLDLSPLVLFFAIKFIQYLIHNIELRMVMVP